MFDIIPTISLIPINLKDELRVLCLGVQFYLIVVHMFTVNMSPSSTSSHMDSLHFFWSSRNFDPSG